VVGTWCGCAGGAAALGEGGAVAILKVLGLALAFGFLFAIAGTAIASGREPSTHWIVAAVVGSAGVLLGAIAGAAQAIVDAIDRQSAPPP